MKNIIQKINSNELGQVLVQVEEQDFVWLLELAIETLKNDAETIARTAPSLTNSEGADSRLYDEFMSYIQRVRLAIATLDSYEEFNLVS